LSDNPYAPPTSDAARTGPAVTLDPRERVATTSVPRYIAAMFDLMLVGVVSVLVAKSASDKQPLLQTALLIGTFLAYYFAFEALLGRTPGKFFTGLKVTQLNGTRCTWSQAAIRTALRLFEVNPLFMGAIPAAAFITFSQRRQRIGDMLAGTLVVQNRSM